MLGCGSIGRRHARNLRALGRTDLVLFDAVPAAARQLAEELDARAVSTVDDVWALAPQVVVVATPPDSHVALAALAAERAIPVFIEKPLSNRMEGVEQLHATIERHGVVAMVACNMRFHPGPAAVKQLLTAGSIGQVLGARIYSGSFLPGWRPSSDYRDSYSATPGVGGAVLDCIHEIDLALWYAGPARLVSAVVQRATSIGLEVEGLAELLLAHDGGTLSSVHLNFVQRDYCRGCTIVGADGTIYWDFEHPFVEVRGGSGSRRITLPPDWTVNQMYMDEMSAFLASVTGARLSPCSVAEGAAVLRIALAARSTLA